MKYMANPDPLSAASETLLIQSYLLGHTRSLLKSDPTISLAWPAFAQSWDHLPQDEYMGDGGTYRFRRYSEFHLVQATHTLSALPHRPYRQSKDDNYLNGEISRLYLPMLQDIQANPAFQHVLCGFADVMVPVLSSTGWLVQVFQNRILAKDGQPGKTTPEGVHRDGVDFVLALMISRANVDGGESAAYAQDGQTLQATVTLKNAGDFIFLDDRMMKHSVQPISRLDPAKEGYRDMLIAMFTQQPQVQS